MAMEQYYSFHSVTLLPVGFVSFLAISLLVLLYRHRSQFTGNNLPPGDIGFPVIGETYEFVSTAAKGHPEKFILDRVKKHSSQVFKTSFIGERTIFFCGTACNKFLFTNENKLVKVWFPSCVDKIFPSSVGTSDVEAAKVRKMLPKFVKLDALQRYFGVIDQCTQSHFADCWENQKEVHAFELAKKYTFKLAARLFISLEDEEDIEKLSKPFHVMNAGITSMPIDLPGTPFNKAIKAANLIRKDYLYNMIKQRKVDLAEGNASPTQDMLSHMLFTTDEDGTYLKESDIADKILGMLVAGFDTLSAELTFVVKYLAELPHIYDAVYREQMEIVNSKAPGEPLKWEDIHKMKYSWNVAQEVMRLAPPVQGAFREALTDFAFNGFTIPKGWKLYWSANSTHKSTEFFLEPEKFDPSRFEEKGPAPYTFLPFGGGPRMCPGNEYTRVVTLVFMHNLVTRFKWEKFFSDEKTTVAPFPTPTKGLPIRLYSHQK